MEIKILNGRKIAATAGKNVYETLKANGIYLVASCGGKGICGKCRVKVLEGSIEVESTGKLLKKEIEEKFVLACKTMPEDDVLIEIPEESKLIIGDKIALSKTQNLLEYMQSFDPVLTPAVRRILLKLTPPSIQDNTGDLERLKRELGEKGIRDFLTCVHPCNAEGPQGRRVGSLPFLH
jgi:ferredoxin